MAGGLIGMLLLQVVQSGLVVIGVSSNWQQIAVGVIMVLAVGLDIAPPPLSSSTADRREAAPSTGDTEALRETENLSRQLWGIVTDARRCQHVADYSAGRLAGCNRRRRSRAGLRSSGCSRCAIIRCIG